MYSFALLPSSSAFSLSSLSGKVILSLIERLFTLKMKYKIPPADKGIALLNQQMCSFNRWVQRLEQETAGRLALILRSSEGSGETSGQNCGESCCFKTHLPSPTSILLSQSPCQVSRLRLKVNSRSGHTTSLHFAYKRSHFGLRFTSYDLSQPNTTCSPL